MAAVHALLIAEDAGFADFAIGTLSDSRRLHVAGRKWAVLMHPTSVYLARHASPYPKIILPGNLLLTLVLVIWVVRAVTSRDRLKEANASLEEAQARYWRPAPPVTW